MKTISKMFLLTLIFLLYSSSARSVSGIGVRTVYSSTTVGTTNWVVLAPTIPGTVSQIAVADSSGQTMEIGICNATAVANSEVRQFLIPAGGITVDIQVPLNQRVSIRAVSAPATVGENNLNLIF